MSKVGRGEKWRVIFVILGWGVVILGVIFVILRVRFVILRVRFVILRVRFVILGVRWGEKCLVRLLIENPSQ
mgnify:CR=1 FL=1